MIQPANPIPQQQPRELKLVTTGRARTLASVTLILVLAHWTARWSALQWTPELVEPHRVPFPWAAVLGLPVLVAGLTVMCLNRVILMGVAWIVGGAVANLSELALHGAVMDFIPRSWPSETVMSLGDVCIYVGLVLLGVGALVVVTSGTRADRARARQPH